jgi:hypothetical protein
MIVQNCFDEQQQPPARSDGWVFLYWYPTGTRYHGKKWSSIWIPIFVSIDVKIGGVGGALEAIKRFPLLKLNGYLFRFGTGTYNYLGLVVFHRCPMIVVERAKGGNGKGDTYYVHVSYILDWLNSPTLTLCLLSTTSRAEQHFEPTAYVIVDMCWSWGGEAFYKTNPL